MIDKIITNTGKTNNRSVVTWLIILSILFGIDWWATVKRDRKIKSLELATQELGYATEKAIQEHHSIMIDVEKHKLLLSTLATTDSSVIAMEEYVKNQRNNLLALSEFIRTNKPTANEKRP